MMTAIRPGTMKFFDSKSGLNQTRIRGSMGGEIFPAPRWFIFCGQEFLRVEEGDGRRISQGDGRGVGVGPIHEDLDGGFPVQFQVAGKIYRNDQAHERLPVVQQLLHVGVITSDRLELEIL